MPRCLWALPLLLLAGCQPDQAADAEAARALLHTHRASLGAVGPALLAPEPAPPPQAGTGRGSGLGMTQARLLPAAAPQPPAAALAPPAPAPQGPAPGAASELLGAAPATLLARLGEPELRRREGDAEVWLYTGAGCQLDLVLYAGAGGLSVAHAQARAGGLAQRSEAGCLSEIAARQGRRGPWAAVPAPPAARATSPGASVPGAAAPAGI